MKRILCIFAPVLMLTACGTDMQAADYGTIEQMVRAPEQYTGQQVMLKGTFASVTVSDNVYCACLVPNEDGTRTQSLEFVTDEPFTNPDEGTPLTVSGEFSCYTEENKLYCRLVHANVRITTK